MRVINPRLFDKIIGNINANSIWSTVADKDNLWKKFWVLVLVWLDINSIVIPLHPALQRLSFLHRTAILFQWKLMLYINVLLPGFPLLYLPSAPKTTVVKIARLLNTVIDGLALALQCVDIAVKKLISQIVATKLRIARIRSVICKLLLWHPLMYLAFKFLGFLWLPLLVLDLLSCCFCSTYCTCTFTSFFNEANYAAIPEHQDPLRTPTQPTTQNAIHTLLDLSKAADCKEGFRLSYAIDDFSTFYPVKSVLMYLLYGWNGYYAECFYWFL